MNKIIFTFLFLIGIHNTIGAQKRFDFSLISENIVRDYIVSVPTGVAPAEGWPLVIMCHGTGGQGDKFYEISKWKELGQLKNFISVFPSALQYCIIEDSVPTVTTKWNCKDIPEILCPNQNIKDDVLFISSMIDSLIKNFPNINTQKIYFSGFSNGSCFGSKLSIELNKKIAAYAGCGGFMGLEDTLQVVEPLPIWIVLGTDDPKFTVPYQVRELPFNDSILILLRGPIMRYLHSLGLENQYQKIEYPNSITYIYNTPLSTIQKSEFRFTIVKGMTHQYPNGDNFPVVAAEIFYDFFDDYCRISTSIEKQDRTEITLYPNPSSNIIQCNGSEENDQIFTITVSDLNANIIFQTQEKISKLVLEKAKIGTGLFFVEFVSANKYISKKIIFK
ncbi:MAG: T9SS type A sorting domain-containing protein [Saprospiraceae bacterium]